MQEPSLPPPVLCVVPLSLFPKSRRRACRALARVETPTIDSPELTPCPQLHKHSRRPPYPSTQRNLPQGPMQRAKPWQWHMHHTSTPWRPQVNPRTPCTYCQAVALGCPFHCVHRGDVQQHGGQLCLLHLPHLHSMWHVLIHCC